MFVLTKALPSQVEMLLRCPSEIKLKNKKTTVVLIDHMRSSNALIQFKFQFSCDTCSNN